MSGRSVQALKNPSLTSSATTGNGGSAETSPTKLTENNAIVPFLTHVKSGCYHTDVIPYQYTPPQLVQKKNPNAVEKLKIFINGDAFSSSFLILGMVWATLISVFVLLKEHLEPLLDTDLSPVAERANDAPVMKQTFSVV